MRQTIKKQPRKSFWSKLTKLEDSHLEQNGCEIEIEQIKKPEKIKNKSAEPEQSWLPQVSEGKLSLDVYSEDNKIIVISAIAGVSPENLEIIVDKDILTIKGRREYQENIEKKNYLHQECFWGAFSRTVLLPFEVENNNIKASLKNGILTIALPRKEIKPDGKIKIKTRVSGKGGSDGKDEKKNPL